MRNASVVPIVAALAALAPCPNSPNCVSSEATDAKHRVEPLRFSGPAEAAQARLRAVIAKWSRTAIVEDLPGKLRAECKSSLFGFVDDLDLVLGDGVIQVRSASRSGWSDLGVNRRRVERLRAEFAAADVPPPR